MDRFEAKTIANAKQPLVPEKDITLDTGVAYPHKSKKKSDSLRILFVMNI